MNDENLEPYKFREGEERTREKGRKGGIASGKVRREKAELRKYLADFMNKEYQNGDKMMTGAELTAMRLSKILWSSDTSDDTFLKAVDLERDIMGEKNQEYREKLKADTEYIKAKTMAIKQSEERDIEDLGSLADLLKYDEDEND